MRWYDPLAKSAGVFIASAAVILGVAGLCLLVPAYYAMALAARLLDD